ncbi:hypothetical protein Tco_1550670, partial [Tanacetum coccineum]
VVMPNNGFQVVGKKKKKGKPKSTNGSQFVSPSVKQNVRYEPKATTSQPKKGATTVVNASKSSSKLKSTGTSSKGGTIATSNSYSALENDDDEDEDQVENAYDESINLFPKAGESSSFTAGVGLDYGLHSLNVDADVLEMSKYVKDYKIILVYVEHGSSIFVTPKKGVSIAVNNHLRKGPIEINSTPDVNKTLTPMCHRNLTKEWEQVSSKSLSICEVMKNLTKKQPSSYVEAPIVVECAEDPFKELDDKLGEYAHIEKRITRNEITGNEITRKQMVVHIGNSSTADDVLELEMLFETKGVGPVRKVKEVGVDADNESEEESDTEGDYTSGSDSEDLDYDPKHDDVFEDDEHIVEEVYVYMNNFSLTIDPKHDTSI